MLATFTERLSRIDIERQNLHDILPVVTYEETGVGRNILYWVVVEIKTWTLKAVCQKWLICWDRISSINGKIINCNNGILFKGCGKRKWGQVKNQNKKWSGKSNCVVLCCQVKVSAMGRSLVQRSPTQCGVPNYVRYRNLKNETAWFRVGFLRHNKKTYTAPHIFRTKLHLIITCLWR